MTGFASIISSKKLMSLCTAGLALAMLARANCSDAETIYFGVTNVAPGQSFVIALSDPMQIAKAREILSGKETQDVHVAGTVVPCPESYNRPGPSSAPWGFHLGPATISFFHFGTASCNKNTSYVNEHGKAGDLEKALFPPAHWCLWGSAIVAELSQSQLNDERTQDPGLPWPWATRQAL